MKCKVLSCSDNISTIEIISKDAPIVGKTYYMDDATNGTNQQNRLWHGLISIYFKSGLYPYDIDNIQDLRAEIKNNLGCSIVDVFINKNMEPIIYNPKKHGKQTTFNVLKSWSRYTKPERMKCIDNLIIEMITVFTENGYSSKKFDSILEEIDYYGG